MLLVRALVVQSAHWPKWAESLLDTLRTPGLNTAQREAASADATRAMRSLGFGLPDLGRATENTDYRTTLITEDEAQVRAGECHIYQVPIPPELRKPGDDFDVRIDVTLSYIAQPRRTRRNLRRYLSTWVDWRSSNFDEKLDDFRQRAMRDSDDSYTGTDSKSLPWALQNNPQHGLIRDVKRSAGTVQKDWALVKSNMLPEHFCIAVVGHQGWSRDPDSTARYALVVTLEILGQEVQIYDPLRVAVAELQAEIEIQTAGEIVVEIQE
jgi:hypothetical protein